MILITGATGKFGGSTAVFLEKNNILFRKAAKTPERLKQRFGNTNNWVAFDWDKPETFGDALEGITTVSLMPPALVTNDFHHRAMPFVDAAKAAGVQHIVLTTALYSDEPDSLFYGTEKLLRNSGLRFTIIRPSFVFQNFLNQFLDSIRKGAIVAPSESGRTSYVDIRNVGEATAVVLADPAAHLGKIYSITGPEALTHKEMAEIFSAELGKKIVHISPSPHEYKERLATLDVPPLLFEFLSGLYGTIAKGHWQTTSNDYTTLTGRRPTRFADFVKEYRSLFLRN